MAGEARVELASSSYGNLFRRQTRYTPILKRFDYIVNKILNELFLNQFVVH